VGFRETVLVNSVLGGQIVWYVNEGFANSQGLFGGNPGSIARCRVKHDTRVVDAFSSRRVPRDIDDVEGDEEVLKFKGTFMIANGDVIEWTSPSAAGYGDPLLRDPEAVLADFVAGHLDEELALRVSGVVITEGTIDAAATSRQRLAVRRERLGREPGDVVEPPTGAQRIGELLHVTNGRWWCNGADLGSSEETYRMRATVRETRMRDTGPEFEVADIESVDRFVFREYLCPVTGYRIDAEIAAEGSDIFTDIEIAASR
jgi:N-methylhydantoinase B